MKPYVKLIINKIRLLIKKNFSGADIIAHGIQLFDYDTKMVFGRNSIIQFGDRIISDGRCVLIVSENASLTIGKSVYFNEGTMISCKSVVEIGEGCQFGPNVKLFDNNHCFDAENGVLPGHKIGSILIGKNCWIGSNVTILKDTNIGDNCIIGAGCVIKGNIPAKSIVTPSREFSIRPIQ